MILQPSILLSTNSNKITIPDSPSFKDKNDLASKTELETTKTQINNHINDFVVYQSQVEQQLQELTTKIDNIKKETLQSIYKVGDVFISFDNKNPSEKFGGTWALEKDRFLIGAGGTYNVDATGGSTTHILTIDEMPSHNHSVSSIGDNTWIGDRNGKTKLGWRNTDVMVITDHTGGGQAHNNMPPYKAVYIWRKTA